MYKRLIIWIAVLALAGLNRQAISASALQGTASAKAKASAQKPISIVILGDASRMDLLRAIAGKFKGAVEPEREGMGATVVHQQRQLHFRAANGETVMPHAVFAAGADIALLAVDATLGPTPIVREHVLVIRQMEVPNKIIVFTKSAAIDDAELLELEELELRELCNVYDLQGDDTLCVFDDDKAAVTAGRKKQKGIGTLVDGLRVPGRARDAAGSPVKGTKFDALVYVLAPEECFSKAISMALKSGPVKIMAGKEQLSGAVEGSAGIAPAGNGDILLRFESSQTLSLAQRFIFLNKGHIYAVGTVSGPHKNASR